jgi:CRISPR-associated protein (TIGR03986 family)
MAVTAPFQFARIPRAVWFPEWGHLVSHDVPFADGYSGTIDIEIEAMTPLLIGGERREAKATKEGEVWPMQLPDGTYAIPGSSLQGMIRNILEIACFGKLGPWVDQRRFGIRDISGTTSGTAAYGSRMTKKTDGVIYPQTKAGWLVRIDGATKLIPCEMARIKHCEVAKLATSSSHTDLLKILTRSHPYHAKNGEPKSKDAPARYAAFLGNDGKDKTNLAVDITLDAVDAQGEKLDHSHSGGKVIHYRLCLAGGTDKGTLVLTGKQSGKEKDEWRNEQKTGNFLPILHTKDMEFVFHSPDRETVSVISPNAISIPDTGPVWRDFESIHSAQPGRKINPNWDYWKSDFEAQEPLPVPIFYIEEVNDTGKAIDIEVIDAVGNRETKEIAPGEPIPGTVTSMGTAFMFKLAHKNDTHAMLNNSSATHVDNKTDYDLASLIFGGVGSESDGWFGHSLKRRASFDWANATLPAGKTGPDPKKTTVLLGPKPSYHPIYVRQPTSVGGLYASYTPAKRRANNGQDVGDVAVARYHPEISGAKVWPSPTDGSVTMNAVPAGAGPNVDVTLNALPAGTKFTTTMHIHNLRKVELGALLWALTLGDGAALTARESKLRHRIGMAKPYGLGSVGLKVNSKDVAPNGDAVDVDLAAIVATFVSHMDRLLETLGSETEQPRDLIWVGANQPTEKRWVDTLQIRGLIEAATPKRVAEHPTKYMPLNGDTGYIERRKAGEALPPLAAQGWEYSRIEDAANVPVEEHLQRLGDRNRGRGFDNPSNGNQNRAQHLAPRMQAPQPNYGGISFAEDAHIRRKRDQAEGFLREKAHGGTWYASFNGGPRELIHPDEVDVIAAPDE